MANKQLQRLEMRFRELRDHMLGSALFGWNITAKAFLRHIGGRGDLIMRSFADHSILFDPADHTISYALMREGQWQREQLERAVRLLRELRLNEQPSLFVDVGAHIGTQSIYAMATGAFEGGLAIEPEPRNFRLLKLNMQINDLADKVTCLQSAAGEYEGELPLFIDPANRSAHSLVRRPDHADGRVRVPIGRLDVLMNQSDLTPDLVGLVWLDVEGFEPQVLRGMPDLLRKSVPLVIETNPTLYEGGIVALMMILQDHYSHFVDLGFATSRPYPLGQLGAITGQHDILVYLNPAEPRSGPAP